MLASKILLLIISFKLCFMIKFAMCPPSVWISHNTTEVKLAQKIALTSSLLQPSEGFGKEQRERRIAEKSINNSIISRQAQLTQSKVAKEKVKEKEKEKAKGRVKEAKVQELKRRRAVVKVQTTIAGPG